MLKDTSELFSFYIKETLRKLPWKDHTETKSSSIPQNGMTIGKTTAVLECVQNQTISTYATSQEYMPSLIFYCLYL